GAQGQRRGRQLPIEIGVRVIGSGLARGDDRVCPGRHGALRTPAIRYRSAQGGRILAVYKPIIDDAIATAKRHVAKGLRHVIGGNRKRLRVHRQQTSAIEGEAISAARPPGGLGKEGLIGSSRRGWPPPSRGKGRGTR